MMKSRVVLWIIGIILLGFGGYTLLTTLAPAKLPGLGLWLLGALVLHDGVLSGLLAVARFMLIPVRRRFGLYFVLVQVAVLVGGLMTLIVVPEIWAQQRGTRNPTVLPLSYGTNLFWFWVGLTVVLIITLIAIAVRRARSRDAVNDDQAAAIGDGTQTGGVKPWARWLRLPIGIVATLAALPRVFKRG